MAGLKVCAPVPLANPMHLDILTDLFKLSLSDKFQAVKIKIGQNSMEMGSLRRTIPFVGVQIIVSCD